MQIEPYINSIFKIKDNEQASQIKLNNKKRNRNLLFGEDGLTVKFIQGQDQNQEVAIVQSNKSIDLQFSYFEVKILKKESRGHIQIGLSSENHPNAKQLGVSTHSIGYLNDGKIHYKKQEVKQIKSYKKDDVVGLFIYNGSLFFTLNGVASDTIHYKSNELMYHSACLFGDVELQFNFGGSPFIFDYKKIQWEQKQIMIDQSLKQEISPYSMHLIIQEYLWSQGYLSTLKSFERESKLQENENERLEKKVDKLEMAYDDDGFESDQKKKVKSSEQMTPMSSLQRKLSGLQSPNFQQISSCERKVSGFYLDEQDHNQELNQIAEQAFVKNQLVNQERQKIQQYIRSGNIIGAIDILNEMIPQFLSKQGISETLYCQQFIELMKQDKLQEAISIGQQKLSHNLSFQIECIDDKLCPIKMKVENIIGLICYDNMHTSALKGLLTQQQRERVSDYINRSLLVELGYEDESALEICLKQLIQVCENSEKFGLLGGHTIQFQ